MEPITEDQEWTLRRWASTVGKRPRKRDKAFLKAEKGLSEEQIDSWWKNIDCTKQSQDDAPSVTHQATETCQNTFQEPTSIVASQDVQQTDSLQFGLSNQNFNFFLPSPSQEIQDWSPIDLSHEEFSDSLDSMLDVHLQSNPWSPTVGTQREFAPSIRSSFSESSPLLPLPLGHRRCMTGSDRSSDSSSLRTWDTASTLVSYCDMYTNDLKAPDPPKAPSESVNPLQICKLQAPNSIAHPQNSTIEGENTGLSRISLPRAHQKIHLPPNFKFPDQEEKPPASSKGQEKYKCTACSRGFNRKGDWKRHEESHDPQTYWTCLLGEPATLSNNGWTCVFCNSVKLHRNDIVEHLIRKHKINACSNKRLEARTFYRKDKLKQHLQQVHSLGDECDGWETWHQAPRKKWAWGCGYCGGCSFTWEGRLIHIAEHYEKQNLGTSPRWSQSMVVKGLLKQIYQDFNVAAAWKELISSDASGDRLLSWNRKNSGRLIDKLQFHNGAAGDVAAEAHQLASSVTLLYANPAWNPSDARIPALNSPLVIEFGLHTWVEEPTDASQPKQYSTSHPRPDVDMQDSGQTFI